MFSSSFSNKVKNHLYMVIQVILEFVEAYTPKYGFICIYIKMTRNHFLFFYFLTKYLFFFFFSFALHTGLKKMTSVNSKKFFFIILGSFPFCFPFINPIYLIYPREKNPRVKFPQNLHHKIFQIIFLRNNLLLY